MQFWPDVFISLTITLLYHQALRTAWSKRLGDQAKCLFLASVKAQSKLSAQRCEELWLDLEHQLNEELRQVEGSMKTQLEAISGQLDQDGQVEKELDVCLDLDLTPVRFPTLKAFHRS